MRLLLLVNEYPPQQRRGTAMATASLAKALAGRGWEVHVIVTRRGPAPAEERDGPVRVYRLSVWPIRYTRTAQRLAMIVRLARRLRPDLVQGQAASCGLFAVVVGRLLGIPSVTYVQGMDFHESGVIRRTLEVGPAIRYADKTIATTEALASAVRPYARRSVEAVPHGYQPEWISPEVVEAARQLLGPGSPNLLYVGFLEPDKGVSYLLSAVAMLVGRWPGLTLHIVGEGPLRNQIVAETDQLGLTANVRFHGEVPHDVVLGLMRRADIFVLPSIREPFGIVLVEAVNEGCPVVATQACGSATAVEPGRTGYVVPAGSAEALAEAMRTVLADPNFKQQMKQSGASLGGELRWDRLVRRFEALYRSLFARPLQVCILVNEYPPDRTAGTAMATYQLARFMAEKGAEISVVVTERAPGSPPLSDDAGTRVYRLRAGWIPIVRWVNRMRRIRRLIGAVKPDLLHAQAISCGLYAAVAALGRKLPVLTSIQGQDLYQASALQRKTEVPWALRAADRVTAVTPALAKLAEDLTGVRPIHVVPHGFLHEQGIASREALRERFGLRPLELVLLCAARLDPIKGVDILVRAVADVPEATVWLAGAGPDRERLGRMADSLGVAGRIQFLGNLPHRALTERMHAADVFVLPSRSEAFGIVLAEAMDAGLPIVASRVGGIPGLVDADNGLLVPPEDPAALAGAIRELLADPGRRASMSRVNPEKAKAYRWETVGEVYWKVYRELLAESRVGA